MEMIRWDVVAAVVAPDVFPQTAPIILPSFEGYACGN